MTGWDSLFRALGSTLVGASVILLSASSSAHEDASSTSVTGGWTWDPWVIGFLTLSGVVYGAGLFRLWSRAGFGRGVRPWQGACFLTSWLLVALALLSPLDGASDVLFSAHMAQHEVLMLLAAPLMALGVPHRTTVFAFPERARERLLAVFRAPLVLAFWRAFTGPLIALGVQVVVVSFWHVPFFFEAALRSEAVHTVQHATFLVAATLFWWAMLSGRYGPAGYGAGLLFVFATALHGGALGAFFTLAGATFYPTHAERTALAGLDAVQDQQLAGLLMWVPGGLILLASGLALFAAWLGMLERRAAPTRIPPW